MVRRSQQQHLLEDEPSGMMHAGNHPERWLVVTDGAGGKAFISDKVPKGKKIRYLRLQEDKRRFLVPGR